MYLHPAQVKAVVLELGSLYLYPAEVKAGVLELGSLHLYPVQEEAVHAAAWQSGHRSSQADIFRDSTTTSSALATINSPSVACRSFRHFEPFLEGPLNAPLSLLVGCCSQVNDGEKLQATILSFTSYKTGQATLISVSVVSISTRSANPERTISVSFRSKLYGLPVAGQVSFLNQKERPSGQEPRVQFTNG